VQMPTLDGLEATRRIRSDRRFSALPIVAMTAHAMAGDCQRCLDAGMNDYLSKPLDQERLLAMVERHAAAPGPTGPGSAAPSSALLRQMHQLFIQLAPERLDNMRAAAAAGDLDAVRAGARRIMSSAASVSAAAVAASARRVDQAAAQADLPEARRGLERLEAELRSFSRSAASGSPS